MSEARTILKKILGNIASAPDNQKFRRLKLSNERIKMAVEADGAMAILQSAGFLPIKLGEEDWLELAAPDAEAKTQCEIALEALATLDPVPSAGGPLVLSAQLPHGGKVRRSSNRKIAAVDPREYPIFKDKHFKKVRGVCGLPNGGVATGALDCVVRVWSGPALDGAPLELRGHDAPGSRAAPGTGLPLS